MDTKFNYFKVATAASYLRYIEGCRFIATNTDRTFPSTDMLLPGSGTLVHMVSFAAERCAQLECCQFKVEACARTTWRAYVRREPDVVVGKPSPKMLEVLAAYAGLDLSRAVMVGDRLNTDIEFGKRQGLHTILVLTGVNTREDVRRAARFSHSITPHVDMI